MGQAGSIPVPSQELFNDFGRCTTSEIFEIVAADNKRFFIHKDILTFQSQPFQEAVKGGRKEATERKIDLKEWDCDTVARMVQFLYTGDYQYPDPVSISPAPGSANAADKRAAPQPQSDSSRSPLDRLRLDLPLAPKHHILDAERFWGWERVKCNYRDTLLSHARIYALARYKFIPALQHLSFVRLGMILDLMEPMKPGCHTGPNTVDLVRYVYATTACRINSKEPLRELISDFIAENFTRWQTEPAAVELMCEGGDFVRDVMAAVSRKIKGGVKSPRATPTEVVPETRFISKLNVGLAAWIRVGLADDSIQVVYGDTGQCPPPGHVQVLRGGDPNLNYPNSSPAWFVPEYSTHAHLACTRFQAPVTYPSRSLWGILGSNFRSTPYLEEVKNQSVEKITEVALVRGDAAGVLDLASLVGYSGMSTNIGRDEALLYLAWKSVKVS